MEAAFALRWLSKFAFKEAQTLGYHGLIESRLRYVFWVFSVSIDFYRFFILQKRALRFVWGLGTQESWKELFHAGKILTLTNIFMY